MFQFMSQDVKRNQEDVIDKREFKEGKEGKEGEQEAVSEDGVAAKPVKKTKQGKPSQEKK